MKVSGVGPDAAGQPLVTVGDNPERMRSEEAAFAMLCGVAPLPASSDKTRRHRLNRGGDRDANCAFWRIAATITTLPEHLRRSLTRDQGALPAQHLHRQAVQQERQAGDVVAGVEHDQDVRITFVPLPGLDQAGDRVADLDGGDGGLVIVGAEPDRVQHRGPQVRPVSSTAMTVYGHPGII